MVVQPNWITALDLEDSHCITFVRGLEAAEALTRLGAEPEAIRPMTFDQALDLTFSEVHSDLTACAVAVPLGGWIVLVEPNGAEGVARDRARALSAGTEMVSTYVSVNYDQQFLYAREGRILADYGEGMPQEDQQALSVLEPYIEQIGWHRFPTDDDAEDRLDETDQETSVRADIALACAISGVYPCAEDFQGLLLGGTWDLSSTVRL